MWLNKNILFCICLFIIGDTFNKDYSHLTLPTPNEYKQLSGDSPIFIFNNTNTQKVRIVESTEELQTNVTPPPLIIHAKSVPSITPDMQEVQPSSNPQQNKMAAPQATHSFHSQESTVLNWSSVIPGNLFNLKSGALVVGTITAAFYGYIYFRLYRLSSLVQNNEGWGSFKQEVPPHHLRAIPIHDLAEGLIEEIQRKYAMHRTNVVPSLLAFNNDIEKELHDLEYYLSWCQWLSKYNIIYIFPNQKNLMIQAECKVQRLRIFKEAITYWIEIHAANLVKYDKEIPAN